MTTKASRGDNRILDWGVLAGFVLLCLAAGWIGSIVTTPAIPAWYDGLNKPPFNPPQAVFPVVWTILYILMGIAAWRVWRAGGGSALVPFFIQLALNVVWSFAFFGARSPAFGFLVIAVLWATIAWTIAAFAAVDRAAPWMMAPYLAWVSFAAVLNGAIWYLN